MSKYYPSGGYPWFGYYYPELVQRPKPRNVWPTVGEITPSSEPFQYRKGPSGYCYPEDICAINFRWEKHSILGRCLARDKWSGEEDALTHYTISETICYKEILLVSSLDTKEFQDIIVPICVKLN
jgi:hypothetical protein